MKMTSKVLAMGVMAAVLAISSVTQASAATVYDYATDFSNTAGNPNGVWSYGYKLLDTQGNPTGEFKLLVDSTSLPGVGMAWGYLEGGQTGFTFKNEQSFAQSSVEPGHVALSADASNRTTARWTAPFSGDIELTLFFGWGAGNRYIMHNNTRLGQEWANPHTSSLHVNIGDTIDVTVWGAGACGNTQTDITIIVPEACPSTDLTGDCFVDMEDFAMFASQWLQNDCQNSNNCGGADFDLSETVDSADLAIFVSHWLEGVTP